MMETKRKTAVAATTTVKKESLNYTDCILRRNRTMRLLKSHCERKSNTVAPHKDYSTLKEKLQEEIAKFLCVSSFGLMYGMVMYALFYICDMVR